GRSAPGLVCADTDHESGVGELDDGVAFRGRETMRDRLRYRAEQPARDHALHELDRVRKPNGDRRPGGDTELRETRGEAFGPVEQLRPHERPVSGGDRGSRRIEGGQPPQLVTERRLAHGTPPALVPTRRIATSGTSATVARTVGRPRWSGVAKQACDPGA